LPLFAIETLEATRARGRLPARMIGTWFGALAVVALLLAAVGVFALTAHNVTYRTEEIGIRMALGANSRDVVGLFLRKTLIQLTIAIVMGLGGAYALSALIGSLLQGVGQRDVLTLAVVAFILGSITLLATLVPARRAARVDPAIALRAE
jgi:ABC-type antimicrobial peptide transport system permease subunit